MRWDSTTTQYDMGFRTYDPGLNQFLSRDMYNGALADTGLSTDPFTGNRYTFGAGNPVSNIELDGHMPCISGGPCGSFQGLARWSSAQQNASTVPVQISPHVDGNQGDPKAKALQAAWSWAVGQYGAATPARSGSSPCGTTSAPSAATAAYARACSPSTSATCRISG